MATAYRVTAPYVVLKVKDPMSGSAMMNGFYTDAIVTDDRVEATTLQRHLDRGWLEKVAEPAAESGGEGDVKSGSGEGGPPPEKAGQGDAKAVPARGRSTSTSK